MTKFLAILSSDDLFQEALKTIATTGRANVTVEGVEIGIERDGDEEQTIIDATLWSAGNMHMTCCAYLQDDGSIEETFQFMSPDYDMIDAMLRNAPNGAKVSAAIGDFTKLLPVAFASLADCIVMDAFSTVGGGITQIDLDLAA